MGAAPSRPVAAGPVEHGVPSAGRVVNRFSGRGVAPVGRRRRPGAVEAGPSPVGVVSMRPGAVATNRPDAVGRPRPVVAGRLRSAGPVGLRQDVAGASALRAPGAVVPPRAPGPVDDRPVALRHVRARPLVPGAARRS